MSFAEFWQSKKNLKLEINKNYKSKLMAELPDSNIHSNLKTLKDEYSVIIANEFFDCLPMCQIKCINEKLYETTIKLDDKLNLVFDETLVNSIVLSTLEGIQPIVNMGQTRWYKKMDAQKTYVIALDPAMAALPISSLNSSSTTGEGDSSINFWCLL